MARPDPLREARVELLAVLSETRLASGALAAIIAGAVVEIVPPTGANPIVTFEVAGRRLARAQLRCEEGRLIATVIDLESDREELDEWRIVEKDPA